MVKVRCALPDPVIGDECGGFPTQIVPLTERVVLPQTDREVEEGEETGGGVEVLSAVLAEAHERAGWWWCRHGKHNPGGTRACPRSPREP